MGRRGLASDGSADSFRHVDLVVALPDPDHRLGHREIEQRGERQRVYAAVRNDRDAARRKTRHDLADRALDALGLAAKRLTAVEAVVDDRPAAPERIACFIVMSRAPFTSPAAARARAAG